MYTIYYIDGNSYGDERDEHIVARRTDLLAATAIARREAKRRYRKAGPTCWSESFRAYVRDENGRVVYVADGSAGSR